MICQAKPLFPFAPMASAVGGLAGSVRDITQAAPDVNVLEAFGASRADVVSAQSDIIAWVQGLEITDTSRKIPG